METCDECGPSVGARVIVSLPSGNVLFYCRHHATEHMASLKALGAFLYPLGDDQ